MNTKAHNKANHADGIKRNDALLYATGDLRR